jgi:hypothetical protein
MRCNSPKLKKQGRIGNQEEEEKSRAAVEVGDVWLLRLLFSRIHKYACYILLFF